MAGRRGHVGVGEVGVMTETLAPSPGQLLTARRSDVLWRWREHARARPPLQALPDALLLEHLPQLVEELSGVLHEVQAREDVDEVRPPPGTLLRLAGQHGRQRFWMGVDVGELVHEYELLREVVLDTLQEEGRALLSAELRVLSRCVGAATAEAVRSHAREQEQSLQAAHAQVTSVLADCPVALWQANGRGIILAAEGGALALLGATPEGLVGDSLFRVFAEQPDVLAAVREALAGRARTQDVALRGHTLALHTLPVREASSGEAVGVSGLAVDVTGRKQLEAVLRQEREALAEAVRAREDVLAILGHDLKSPLHTVRMAAELLGRSQLTPSQAGTVRCILSATDRATRLIVDLLDFTQARLGPLPLIPGPTDLHAVARQVVDEVSLAHPGRDIHFLSSGGGEGLWDGPRVAQALTNLLSNALQYGAAGAPVRVVLRWEDGWACLDVHNLGPPIPPDAIPCLFEPYLRGSDAVPTGRNVGLGLFITRQIARAHGGDVEVRSSAAEGTTFTLRLLRTHGGAAPTRPTGG